MRIAVASGKGGTGKTTVATSLARIAASRDGRAVYVDCDVEEPNGHIFLKPDIETSEKATMLYPVVNEEKCISCGKCAEICQFKAIIMLKDTPLVFPELCHDCGGCHLVCPTDAISLRERVIGVVEKGRGGDVEFIHGKLDVGQALSPPLIRNVKRNIDGEGTVIVDCPPGTSCPVIEAVRGADYTILVTEPTPFGMHDLGLAVQMLDKLSIPYGVFINRSDIGTGETLRFCEKRSIPVLASLKNDRRIAESYSRGDIIIDTLPEYGSLFLNLYNKIAGTIEK